MQVDIKSCIPWAQEAEGIAVVIDVLRASNTIIAAMSKGAEYIIPVWPIEEARALKKQFSDYLLFWERYWKKAEKCDYSNSPTEVGQLPITGKKIILTTSWWSQVLVNTNLADEVVIGSFANAHAIVQYIRERNPEKVTLIPVWFDLIKPGREDELCAQYIHGELVGNPMNFEAMQKEIREGEVWEQRRWWGQEADLEFCTQLDTYDIVPYYDRESKKIFLYTSMPNPQ